MEISKICLNNAFFQRKNNNSVQEKSLNFSTNPLPCKLLNSPSADTFVKSPESISFTSNRGPAGKTSEAFILKGIDRIRGPYSGIPMISRDTMEQLCDRIDKANSPQDMMNIIRPYQDCLQPVQKEVFYLVDGYLNKYPNASINECLASKLPTSVRRLGEKERQILTTIHDSLDTITFRPDKNKLKRVVNDGIRKTREYTTGTNRKGETVITGSNFRRKKLINSFKDVKSYYCDNNNEFYYKSDERIFTPLEKLYESLPESKYDFDAFVVKYGQPNKSNKEIARNIIQPSMATVEHIKTVKHGGKNDLRNFMLATDIKNSERSDDNLATYARKHPEIKQYCQWYTDDIIGLIKEGKMKGYEWYPYALKETLKNESAGEIVIDVSELNLTEKQIQRGIAYYEVAREERLTRANEMH